MGSGDEAPKAVAFYMFVFMKGNFPLKFGPLSYGKVKGIWFIVLESSFSRELKISFARVGVAECWNNNLEGLNSQTTLIGSHLLFTNFKRLRIAAWVRVLLEVLKNTGKCGFTAENTFEGCSTGNIDHCNISIHAVNRLKIALSSKGALSKHWKRWNIDA